MRTDWGGQNTSLRRGMFMRGNTPHPARPEGKWKVGQSEENDWKFTF